MPLLYQSISSVKLANKTWASSMIKHSRCKQKEAKYIFNRLFFKSWRETIGAYKNNSLSSLVLIFEAIILRNQTEGKNMLNSYMLNSVIPGKEEHFWYLNEFIKQGKVFYDCFEKKG